MKIGVRRTGFLRLLAISLLGAGIFACSGTAADRASGDSSTGNPPAGKSLQAGIPAPDSTLNDTSPDVAFLRYGDSLRFAADTPGTLVLRRVVGRETSELRVRSETRLPQTVDSAYRRGRIIAKFETVGAPSRYGVPVGNAYLWVHDTADGTFRGTLFWQNYVDGTTGRTKVLHQLHTAARPGSGDAPACRAIIDGADTVGVCCLCGDGRCNSPLYAEMSMARLDSVVSKLLFTRRTK